MLIHEVIKKPPSPERVRVNALNDQAKRLRAQAKQLKAQQRLRKAQADLARAVSPSQPLVAVWDCAAGNRLLTVPQGSKGWAVRSNTKSVVNLPLGRACFFHLRYVHCTYDFAAIWVGAT